MTSLPSAIGYLGGIGLNAHHLRQVELFCFYDTYEPDR